MSSNNIINDVLDNLENPIVVSSLHDEEDTLLDYFTDPFEIYQRYENAVDLVIDGGKGKLIASTVVNLVDNNIEIIRQGKGILN